MAEFNAKQLLDSLTKDEVIKDVIRDTAFQPWGSLQIQYPNGQAVENGNLFKPVDTKPRPTIKFQLTDSSKTIKETDLFTLIMTDPDAPSRTNNFLSEICHLVQTDIKLNTSGEPTEIKEVAEKVLMPYLPCGPPEGTGKHRYIFLLYKQSEKVPSTNFTPVKDKFKWGFDVVGEGAFKWANENELTLIAANYFQAQYFP
ncbi:hypothetical protein NCAS_0B08630 [Naumovozyma castellii]|uniref:Uncharacterized protein n=1 Tax=Naumovozyma castellii TaxID=27288 RepID=G0VAS0_NAUCA|nr:hypothetical protein NCAS_0B08630 [Naumovozyma castellii CBS 4309]CCC68947.1 hypothetical protein NCAS_0B08630 [Naumovozyma castellii CBS 4309]